MYAVIKTGGKQYRVQAGDLLVVEKLDGEPGSEVAFGEVLMLGEGEAVTVGAPTVDGAVVSGTLIETRRGEKVKIFKKIRRQAIAAHAATARRTVVRVTSVSGAGSETKWDGVIDLTPKVILNARARGLGDAAVPFTIPVAKTGAPVAEAAPKKKAAPKKAAAAPEDGEA